MKAFLNRNKFIYFIVISIVFSAGIIYKSHQVSKEFYVNRSYFYDPVMTLSKNIALYTRMQEEAHLNPIASRINFALLHFKADPKGPLLYIPTILFAPDLLPTPWSSLPMVLIALSIFLTVFSYAVYIRTKSKYLSFALLLFFCVAPLHFESRYGLLGGWQDLTASFFLVSGLICFLNWHHFAKRRWLILSGLFIAITSYCRSTFIVYAFLLLIVPILISAVSFVKKGKSWKEALIQPVLLVSSVVILVSAPFYITHFENNFWYYTHLNSGIIDSVKDSVFWFLSTVNLVGPTYCVLLSLCFLLVFLYSMQQKTVLPFSTALMGVWMVVALPFQWLILMHTSNTYHVYMIEFTIIYSMFIPLFTSMKVGRNKKIAKIFAVVLIFISLPILFYGYKDGMYVATHASDVQKDTKKLDRTIAEEVHKLDINATWLAYFEDDYARIPNCEVFYQYGVYPKNYADNIMYYHKSYWHAFYPEKSAEEIAQLYCDELTQSELIVIFDKKEDIDKRMPNDAVISKVVLHQVHDSITNSKTWEKTKIYSSVRYGELAFYKKKKVD